MTMRPARKPKKDAKLTVRLSPFEAKRLLFIRTHGRPLAAGARPAAQCAVDAILYYAAALEDEAAAPGPTSCSSSILDKDLSFQRPVSRRSSDLAEGDQTHDQLREVAVRRRSVAPDPFL